MWKRLKVAAIGSIVVMMATTTACGRDYVSPKNAAPTQNPTHSQVQAICSLKACHNQDKERH